MMTRHEIRNKKNKTAVSNWLLDNGCVEVTRQEEGPSRYFKYNGCVKIRVSDHRGFDPSCELEVLTPVMSAGFIACINGNMEVFADMKSLKSFIHSFLLCHATRDMLVCAEKSDKYKKLTQTIEKMKADAEEVNKKVNQGRSELQKIKYAIKGTGKTISKLEKLGDRCPHAIIDDDGHVYDINDFSTAQKQQILLYLQQMQPKMTVNIDNGQEQIPQALQDT
jgi:hypothetical protein